MNNFAINNIANMEWQLYGGRSGMSMSCPSMYNNYMPSSGMGYNYGMNYTNPAFMGYGNYGQDIFTKAGENPKDNTNVNNIYKTTAENNPTADLSNPQFKGLSDDLNELGDYYIKNSAPSESFMGAAVGGAAFGVLNNPRMVVHPINSITSTGAVEKIFADVKKDGTKLNQIWNNKYIYKGQEFKGGYELLSNAYSRRHKLESLHNKKLGLFRRSLVSSPEREAEYKRVKKGLDAAIKAGNIEEIAKWTEEAKRLTNRFTGYIPNGLRKIGLQKPLTAIRKFINPTHYQNLGEVATKNITDAGAKSTFRQFMTHSCGVGNGIMFAGLELAMDVGKIQTAFSKDSSTGWKQIRQSLTKGVGSAVGWAVGEGIGAFAGAKIGAALGTAVAPGVGTAIGAIAGLVGGSIGCWLAGKITHKVIGKEAGTQVEVENMKKTAEGQKQLLQLTLQQAEENKESNQRTISALNNVASFYGLA